MLAGWERPIAEGNSMKKVEALIPAFQVDVVTDALRKQGVEDMVISEVLESCPSRARAYRGVKYAVDYAPEIQLETVVSDELATSTANCIVEALRTGRLADAKIVVTAVDAVVEIGGRAHDRAPTWNADIRSGSWAGKSREARSGA